MSPTIFTRRRFLKQAGGFAGASAFATALDMHKWAAAAPLDDYKALVCVFLYGGNDGMNTVVPRSGAAYTNYAAARGPIKLAAGSLLPINPITAQSAELGFPAAMAEMHALFQQQRLAVLSNVGPLVVPTTRAQFLAQSVALPRDLFAHDEQQEQWQSLQSYAPNSLLTGWGGRTADLLRSLNATSRVSLSISINGSNVLQIGRNVVQYQMSPGGTIALDGYQSSGGDQISTALRAIFSQSRGNMLDAAGNTKMSGAIETEQALAGALNAAPPFTTYKATVELGAASKVTTFTSSDFGRTLANNEQGTDHAWGNHHFIMGGAVKGGDCYGKYPTVQLGGPDDSCVFPDTYFAQQLKMTARLIGISNLLGIKRQIFFTALGGFDTHGDQNVDHPVLLRNLSKGLDAFDQGRWIPTTAVDQYAATLAKWFGVSATDIPLVVPNIGRFVSRDLGFMLA